MQHFRGTPSAQGMQQWPALGSGLLLHEACSAQAMQAQGGCSVSHLPAFLLVISYWWYHQPGLQLVTLRKHIVVQIHLSHWVPVGFS